MRVSLPTYFSLFVSILLFGLNSTSLLAQYPTDFTASQTTICEGDVVEFTPVNYELNTPISWRYSQHTNPSAFQTNGHNFYNPALPVLFIASCGGQGQMYYTDAGTYGVSLTNDETGHTVNKPNLVSVNPAPSNSNITNSFPNNLGWDYSSTAGMQYAELGQPLFIDTDNQQNKYALFKTLPSNTTGTNEELELIKFDKNNVPLWNKIIRYQPVSGQGVSVTLDKANSSIYLILHYSNGISLNPNPLNTYTGQGSIIAKYISGGGLSWTKPITNSSNTKVVANNGHVIVAGAATGNVTIGGNFVGNPSGFYLAKLSSANGSLTWKNLNSALLLV